MGVGGIVRVRTAVVVCVAVRVGRVVRVVVRMLLLADTRLEAGQRDAVDAGVAVHPDGRGTTPIRLGVPLEHEVGELVAVPDDLGDDSGKRIRVPTQPLSHLCVDTGRQDAGEEEERQHDYAPSAERTEPVKALSDGRFGERDECGLHLANSRVPCGLPERYQGSSTPCNRARRRRRGGGPSIRYSLAGGDLVVMGGSCQRTWEHAIPKALRTLGARISIQFRPHGVS